MLTYIKLRDIGNPASLDVIVFKNDYWLNAKGWTRNLAVHFRVLSGVLVSLAM